MLSSSKASSVSGWLIGVSKHTAANVVGVAVTSVGSCALETGIAVAHQINKGVAVTEALQQVVPGTISASFKSIVSGAAAAALAGVIAHGAKCATLNQQRQRLQNMESKRAALTN